MFLGEGARVPTGGIFSLGRTGVMRIAFGYVSRVLLALTFLFLLVSCDESPAPRSGGAGASLAKAKNKTREFASLAGKIGDSDSWKKIVLFMSDDFEFRDAEGNVKKGSSKDVGARPLKNSLKPEGLLRYEQFVGDARDLGGGLVEVDARIKLEIKSGGGVKMVEWPACFSWCEKNGKWRLESVEYVDAPKVVQKGGASSRGDGGGEPAGTNAVPIETSSRVGDHSAGTCLKVKRLIQGQVDTLSRKNRTGERK